ncbi:acyl-CoA N-acyltransferase [Calocera viscosa TUFC12733]|uniref:Acyl-CoA N-acyltransferase n=1 Tax=Calocera viscosa (strain TUFC12733) TaxID=1330018 RepID=A0A167M4W4_CALVF|nr:acyl-CoA N-acyltransferase [Calocera viscosa TUFC12733]
MAFAHRQPILFDKSRNDEPYIPLPAPHDNIRMTPWRLTDVEAVPILNHPAVYPNLLGPPYPYTKEDAEDWASQQVKQFEPDRQYFTGDEGAPVKEGKLFDYAPMPVIREVQPDGSQIFLGVSDIVRSNHFGVTDKQRKEELTKENEAKPLGDPSIMWMIGDYLAPSHHGKGIMTAAIRELIRSWCLPYMHVREIEVMVIEGNLGSRRVFEKLGFKYTGVLEGVIPTQGKREKVMDEWLFRSTVE